MAVRYLFGGDEAVSAPVFDDTEHWGAALTMLVAVTTMAASAAQVSQAACINRQLPVDDVPSALALLAPAEEEYGFRTLRPGPFWIASAQTASFWTDEDFWVNPTPPWPTRYVRLALGAVEVDDWVPFVAQAPPEEDSLAPRLVRAPRAPPPPTSTSWVDQAIGVPTAAAIVEDEGIRVGPQLDPSWTLITPWSYASGEDFSIPSAGEEEGLLILLSWPTAAPPRAVLDVDDFALLPPIRDEDFWVNPTRPVTWPTVRPYGLGLDPEEPPTLVVAAVREEDLWTNPTAPWPARVVRLPPAAVEVDDWVPFVAPSTLVQEDDGYLPPRPWPSIYARPFWEGDPWGTLFILTPTREPTSVAIAIVGTYVVLAPPGTTVAVIDGGTPTLLLT